MSSGTAATEKPFSSLVQLLARFRGLSQEHQRRKKKSGTPAGGHPRNRRLFDHQKKIRSRQKASMTLKKRETSTG